MRVSAAEIGEDNSQKALRGSSKRENGVKTCVEVCRNGGVNSRYREELEKVTTSGEEEYGGTSSRADRG